MAQGSVIKVNGQRGATYAIRFYGQDGKRYYKTIGPRKGDGRITGMRQSEVLGLAWGDIDWQSGKR